ncbi:MAG: hypothetical protein AAF823_06830 [Planctomycetota bacterium]
MIRVAVAAVVGLAMLLGGGGCAIQFPAVGFEGAELSAASIATAEGLDGRYRTARYAFHDTDTMTAVLLPASVDRPAATTGQDAFGDLPGSVVTMRLMWRSKPARTPIDADATNCSFQFVVRRGEEVGVYSGAGYLLLNQRPGTQRINARILNATLVLTDTTPGFADDTGQAELAGRLTLLRDDDFVGPAIRGVNAAVSEALGFPRVVDGNEPPHPAADHAARAAMR